MLSELTVSNFAIIERQTLSFHDAFNVISGETGAGKSIILNALEFILGGKASLNLIRSGSEQMEVQALFDLTEIPQAIRSELPEIVGDGDELVVSRTLPREGRSKVLINGRLGTVALLEEIVGKLVNICSQHHQTKLLDPRFHLDLLDGFAGVEPLCERMREAHREWASARAELAKLREAQSRGQERRAELEETLLDLDSLPNLKPGRRSELEAYIKRIGNFERLGRSGQQAIELLSGEDGVSERLRELSGILADMSKYDPATAPIATQFDEARELLSRSDIAIARYVNGLDVDASTLEEYREELSNLARLERKYRADDLGLCALQTKARHDLSLLGGGEGMQKLEKDVEARLARVTSVGLELRKARQTAAKKLAAAVAEDLKELNMRDASVLVRFTESEPTPTGIDKVDFLFSANKGVSHGALSQIASGGELSRIMLVLKKILRERSGVNVLIFDEVDTGISGGVARSVGRMLKDISGQSQVICITHLPQVASLSDKHFLVEKEVGDRAVTVVRALTEGEKVDEIARMLAGFTITEASRASARELIESR